MNAWQALWRHPITRIVGFLLLFLVIMLALTVPVTVWLVFRQHAIDSTAFLFYATAAEAVAVVAAFVFMVRLADRRSLNSAGIAIKGVASETAAGFLIGAAMLSVIIGTMAFAGVYHELGKSAAFHPLSLLVLFLLVAIAEELIFRGYVFQTLESRWGTGYALVISSILFGAMHSFNPGPRDSLLHHWAGPVFITIEAGLPLCAGYLLTRRMWLPIGLHWAWNFFEGPVYGADVSGLQLGSLYHARFTGPFFLSGGTFGPEASVMALVIGTFVGLLLLRAAIRAGHWRSASQPMPAVAEAPAGEETHAE